MQALRSVGRARLSHHGCSTLDEPQRWLIDPQMLKVLNFHQMPSRMRIDRRFTFAGEASSGVLEPSPPVVFRACCVVGTSSYPPSIGTVTAPAESLCCEPLAVSAFSSVIVVGCDRASSLLACITSASACPTVCQEIQMSMCCWLMVGMNTLSREHPVWCR